MAKFALSLTFFCLCLLLSSNSGIIFLLSAEQGGWCVAKPSATEQKLRANMNYACVEVGSDCSVIQNGGECYYPNTTMSHASVAMNLYYQKMGRNPWNCDFNNSALVTVTDPSRPCMSYLSIQNSQL
ncbi:Glucan endo-1,3-beta-D-glucosidase [Bertholletia excelsa]